MSCSSLFAVKRAIEAARKDVGNEDFFPLCMNEFIPINNNLFCSFLYTAGPATIETIHASCRVNTQSFTI